MKNELEELRLSMRRLEDSAREMEHVVRMLLLATMAHHRGVCTRRVWDTLSEARRAMNRKNGTGVH
jgi:hypothetical protein